MNCCDRRACCPDQPDGSVVPLTITGAVTLPAETPCAQQGGRGVFGDAPRRDACTPEGWRIGLRAVAVLAIAVVLAPLAYIVLKASSDAQAATRTLLSPAVWNLAATTIALAACVTLSSLSLASALAWCVARVSLPGGRLWLVLLALPLAAPSFLIAETWGRATGVRGFAGAWIALTLATYPLAMLPLEAAIRRASRDLEHAARGLGCGRFTAFRRGTLPQLVPTLEWTGLLVALYALSDFGAPAIVHLDVLTTAIESRRSGFDSAGVATLAAMLCVMSVACIVGIGRVRSSKFGHACCGHVEQHAVRTTRALPRVGALTLYAATLGAALGVPLWTVGSWFGLAMDRAEGSLSDVVRTTFPAARDSLTAAGLATILAVTLTLPFVMLACRSRIRACGRGQRLASLALLGYGLPGIVVGFAFVRLALDAPQWLAIYQTLPLLILGYLSRSLAEAIGPAMASARRLPCSRLEAARGLGAGYLHSWARIGLPAVAPGLLAGGALVFLTIIKELPITLVLRPTGFDTLAFELFDSLNEAMFHQAGPAAVVLLVVSGAIVAGLVAWQRD